MISLSPAQIESKRNAAITFPRDTKGRLIAIMPDDTMAGEIECRATIIIDNRTQIYLEDGVFAFFIDGIFMVKRLKFLPDGILVLPKNKNYQNWKIEPSEKSELVIIGRVAISLSEKTH